MYGYSSYPSYGYSAMNTGSTVVTIAAVLALVLAIVSMILIVPKKRRPTLNGFFKFVHDLFNFRFLLIEKIVQFAYIFTTFFVMVAGVFILFMSFGAGSAFGSVFMMALGFIVFGPVLIRLMYEGIMMFILLVKNVIEINNKLQDQTPDSTEKSMFGADFNEYRQAAPAPVQPTYYQAPQQPVQDIVFCSQCGTQYDRAQGGCPNCNQ